MEEENDCFICVCSFPICMLFPERGKGCQKTSVYQRLLKLFKNTSK